MTRHFPRRAYKAHFCRLTPDCCLLKYLSSIDPITPTLDGSIPTSRALIDYSEPPPPPLTTRPTNPTDLLEDDFGDLETLFGSVLDNGKLTNPLSSMDQFQPDKRAFLIIRT